jgi:Beta-lactamase enzyme family
MTHGELAQALLQAIRAQHFEATPDAMCGGAPIAHFPSLDLAVIAFPHDAPPVWANVLFSRERPLGLVADIAADAGPVRNLRYLADRTDAAGVSDAWLPDADWSKLHFEPLAGNGAHRFVAPYPASLAKLMVAVGVALQVDAAACEWTTPVAYAGRTRSIAAWAVDMLAISCNDSTSALVALLHTQRAIVRELDGQGGRETHNALHEAFAAQGLATLRLADTKADGGWRNADAAGVGHLQMTAWDSARLLWLLDAQAPRAPWPPIDAPKLLGDESRAYLRAWLDAQALDGVLSGALRADIRFAHKTGSTENYAADAGIVYGIAPSRRHYIVALTSNLGTRYAPGQLPALGAAIDATMAAWLEHRT